VFTLPAIVAGCWRELKTFRTAGVAAAYVTLARLPRKPAPPFPPGLRLKRTQARWLPCLCADEAGNIYSACSSAECTTSPRREEKVQQANETLPLRRNAAWHHDQVPCPVPICAQKKIPTL